VACPVNQTTTLVFPEALKQLRSPSREAKTLGLSVERTKPRGVIVVRPTTASARGTIEFRGTTRVLQVTLEATPEGTGREIRLGEVAPPLVVETVPAPVATPSPPPPTVPSPSPSPTPTPSPLDLEGLLRATAHDIDRREGLPGQPAMILKDALYGDERVWLRFVLEDGARAQVDRVWWEQGEIPAWVQETSGKDLRIVVQVPRASVTRKTRVSLKVTPGGIYRFALTPSTLTNFFKELFK
jgi:hypothetical protein